MIHRSGKDQRRRGFSLIEMMVVISTMVLALGLLAGSMTALMRLENAIRERGVEAQALQRLARQLRDDVHDAATATAAPAPAAEEGPAALELDRRDGSHVRYEVAPGQLVRLVTDADTEAPARIVYRLGEDVAPRFEIGDVDGRKLVRLTLSPVPDDLAFRRFVVETFLDRNDWGQSGGTEP